MDICSDPILTFLSSYTRLAGHTNLNHSRNNSAIAFKFKSVYYFLSVFSLCAGSIPDKSVGFLKCASRKSTH